MEYKLHMMSNTVFNKFSVPTLTYGLSFTSHLVCVPYFRLGNLLQELNSGTVTINWNVSGCNVFNYGVKHFTCCKGYLDNYLRHSKVKICLHFGPMNHF